MGGQLVAIQQVKNLSNDGIRRFREEVGFRESGVWVVIELYRRSGLGILPAQFANRVKDVLLGEEAFLLQHLDQRGYAGLRMHHPSPSPITIVRRHAQVRLPNIVP